MNILAIDTLSAVITVAAKGPKGLAVQSFAGSGRSHAEQLIPMIDSVVCKAGFTAAQTELVLAPEGPGSFTGLRLGYAAAKALQLSSKSTFVPVPTLPCLAFQYRNWQEGLAVVIDAKRERFYTQLFIGGKPVTEALDAQPGKLMPFFLQSTPWLIAGYGSKGFYKSITALADNTQFYTVETPPLPFAQTMIDYVQDEYSVQPAADSYAGPVYIRKSDAEKDTLL